MRLTALVALAVGLSLACTKAVPEQTSSSSDNPSSAPASAPAAPAHASSAAAMPADAPVWTDPSAWKRGTPKSSMRVAEYAVPHAAGDTEDAECVVYHFGAGQGGSADENITRWKGQFADSTDAKTDTKQVSGMKVTRLELSGTYAGGMMPAPGQPQTGPKPHQRMIAAVVEAPAGSWFFKLTGPDATVKANESAFDALIASLH